jgi:hypothetical protein
MMTTTTITMVTTTVTTITIINFFRLALALCNMSGPFIWNKKGGRIEVSILPPFLLFCSLVENPVLQTEAFFG